MSDNKELTGAMAEALKEATGLTPEQFKEKMAALDEFEKRQKEADTKAAIEVARGQVQFSSYENRAKHVINSDPHKGLGLKWARMARATAAGRLEGRDPRVIAKDVWGDAWLADAIDSAFASQKALAAGNLAAGGALTPDEYLGAEIIELLRSQSVLRQAGARTLPMRSGSLSIPRQTAAATAAYTGENTNATSSQQSFGQIQMTARKLVALTPVSNDLLRESDPSADALVRDDLVRVMALKEDISFLRADGTQNQPMGIRHQASAANIFEITHATSVATSAEVIKDLTAAMQRVKSANVQLVRPVWIMSTRSLYFLMTQRDADGWVFPTLQGASKTLFGYPVFESNQLPETLDVSGDATNDESEVYFVEMTEFLIADQMRMDLQVIPFGAYHDGSNVISGISQDQTVIMTISKHDCALRHEEAASILTAVDWKP